MHYFHIELKVSIGETELRKTKHCKLIRLQVSNNTPIKDTNYEQYTSNIARYMIG